MKRILSAALALTLLSGTAAMADPYDHGGRNYGGYSDQYRGHDNSGAIVAGVGFLTLAAILASQHRHHRSWYHHERSGYDHDRGYGYQYGDRQGGYGYDYNQGYGRAHGDNDRRW